MKKTITMALAMSAIVASFTACEKEVVEPTLNKEGSTDILKHEEISRNSQLEASGTTLYYSVGQTWDFGAVQGRTATGSYSLYASKITGICMSTADITLTYNNVGGSTLGSYIVWAGTKSDLDSKYKLEYSTPVAPSRIVGQALGTNGVVYTWYKDGTKLKVMAGSNTDLDYFIGNVPVYLPNGYTSDMVIGVGIAKSNGHCYFWFNNGKVCSGTESYPETYKKLYDFHVAAGESIADVVGICIDKNDKTVAFYK